MEGRRKTGREERGERGRQRERKGVRERESAKDVNG